MTEKEYAKKIVNVINKGEYVRYLPFFVNIQNLVNFLIKNDVLYLVKYSEAADLISNVNEVYLNMINGEHGEYVMKHLVGYFCKTDSGVNYILVDNCRHLKYLFVKDNPFPYPQEYVQEYFQHGPDFFGSNLYVDPYNHVIKHLNEENMDVLKKYIIREIDGEIIHLDGDEITINGENIDKIVSNKRLMNIIIEDMVTQLDPIFAQIYTTSANYTFEKMLEEPINECLSEFFNVRKKPLTNDSQKLDVTGHIQRVIYNFLENEKEWNFVDYEYVDIIDYLMKKGVYERLDFEVPQFRENDVFIDNLNSIFKEWL